LGRTQFQSGDRDAGGEGYSLKPEQREVASTLLGGGFGRRSPLDSHVIREAVQISKTVKVPVKVVWTARMTCAADYYRPRAIIP